MHQESVLTMKSDVAEALLTKLTCVISVEKNFQHIQGMLLMTHFLDV